MIISSLVSVRNFMSQAEYDKYSYLISHSYTCSIYLQGDYVAMSKIQDRHNSSDSFSDDDCKENEFSVDEGIYSLPSNLITSTPLPLMCNGYQVGLIKVYSFCSCQTLSFDYIYGSDKS